MGNRLSRPHWFSVGCIFVAVTVAAPVNAQQPAAELPEQFFWRASPPLVGPKPLGGDEKHALKDPSVVYHDNRWHLFCTVRGQKRSHGIVYLNFADWNDAKHATQTMLPMHTGFFCAPQVFYYRPYQQWYLICQASDESWSPPYQPAFATSKELADPRAWSKLTPFFGRKPPRVNAWLDFWAIGDERHAYVFFTSLDGKMWRSRTPINQFPKGWSDPVVALQADVFEASHTYRVQGRRERYLTVIEAQGGHGWRYFKAYVADRLDGAWQPLAATKDHAFASIRNVAQPGKRWTDAISHGELIRAGVDERMEVDPNALRFVFQGVLEEDRRGKKYGEIPWRLGILEPATRLGAGRPESQR
jgi:hypothetical protein